MTRAFQERAAENPVPVVPVSQHRAHVAAKAGTLLAFRSPQGRPPLVISRQENNTQRIAALDEEAERLRLKRGMGIADARAMYPSIEIVEADPEADRRLIEALADWCDRYTPLVALDGTDGLFLDITGCAHLFGGERAMLDDIVSRFFDQGFRTRRPCLHAGSRLGGGPIFAPETVIQDEERSSIFSSPFRSPPCGSKPATTPAWKASACARWDR